MKTDYPIDFVVTWLDSSDPEWLAEYAKYRGNSRPEDSARFRNWDFFRYWFRAVDCYAPWVNKVHVVTCGHYPEWLNLNNPKLLLVKHTDYIPQEFLPTFNSDTIELNMGRIDNLAEHFVYFNDDMLLNSPVFPNYYFRDGLPVDCNIEKTFKACDSSSEAHVSYCVSQFYNMCIINRNFNRRGVIKKSPLRWFGGHIPFSTRVSSLLSIRKSTFDGFEDRHFEQPYLKSVFQDIWNKEETTVRASCTRFRKSNCLLKRLARYWQFASNEFSPYQYGPSKYLQIMPGNIEEISKSLNDLSIRSVCLNDIPECSDQFYKQANQELMEIFENKFPQKSSFEL